MVSEQIHVGELKRQLPKCMLRDRFRLCKAIDRLRSISDPKRSSTELEKIQKRIDHSASIVDSRRKKLPKTTFPSDLPVNQRREEIGNLIRENQVVIVCGETGSGKSTQLPKICIEAGQGIFGKIGHTQPRRIAARSVAARIAEELKTPLGQQVGYKVRFNDQTSELTHIKLMTDGILLAETQTDRFLEEYDTIIIDEAHERSLNIDFLLGYLKSILTKRRDLKVIITSATIDANRFSEHFSIPNQIAPIIEVSGRSHPVDILYRPYQTESEFGNDGDMFDGINDAVQEISSIDTGDMLIFLPTEKDIRTAAKKLRNLDVVRNLGIQTEILPLYARLSVAEQNKIFKPEKSRRIVLATNVAESSLTVPRIKYVIDTGTARISRYASRSKIQRLPIERISQASANQRAGRCGRLGPGICIRLFSEEDFESRDRFTTPEIRRTNLASVILQAKAMHFGDIEKIQFLDPPRPEAIRDGYKTLFEVGATDASRDLTKIGSRIKNFPCDPRISRMILAGDDEGVLGDVLIIAAALEVQDVRDRPVEKQKQADAAHEKFVDPDSDFITYLKIWDFYHQQKSKLSNSQLRKALQQNFLSFNRMREWLEIFRQLRDLCSQQKIKIGARKNDYDKIHRSIMAGLLSGIANRGEKYSYAGAGGIQLFLWPGSGVRDLNPKWILGSELVETSKRYLRNVARIQPNWIEPLSQHLVSRSYSDPLWHENSEQVMANEKVSLFGLTIVPRRRVPYGKMDASLCRALFIEEGLVQQKLLRRHFFLENNCAVIADAEELAAKTRKREFIVESTRIINFYEERLPEHIIDGVSLHNWLKQDRKNEERLLMETGDILPIEEDTDASCFPSTLGTQQLNLQLKYAFEPGNTHDGVTATIPAAALSQLNSTRIDWLVPGMVEEKVTALIRSLPKSKRRPLVPAPDKAKLISEKLEFAKGNFLTVVANELSKIAEEPITSDDFDLSKIDQHLKMNIAVTDDSGEIIEQDRNLAALQEKYCGGATLELSSVENSDWHEDNITSWTFGDVPEQISVNHGGIEIPSFPAVIDRGDSVSLRLVPTVALAKSLTEYGVMRLAAIQQKKAIKTQIRWLPDLEGHALIASQFSTKENLHRGLKDLVAKLAFIENQKFLPKDETDFETLMSNAIEKISVASQQLANVLPKFFSAYQELQLAISERKGTGVDEVVAAIKSQVKRLMPDDFWLATPWMWLQRYPTYFRSAKFRLEKLSKATIRQELEMEDQFGNHLANHEKALQRHQSQGIHDVELTKFRWMVEELRISTFSQQLGTLIPVSEKRMEKQWLKVE